ncbi:probable 3-beta-hydroxysteroid-Delta(8),Delta(7)-isomerase [Ananas comosus]|uniref:Probable 3-beta-hydroxysteroid-Delta(8),Delta(7)-isomerase n=1 Tax=Ananas comosus TaxID=4615 RepID=A0A6P5EDH6_ANACO|nr:probable 3-beta-hydroxysteroid-Delta(8),Delta(7)-isomerase [Ananas comosus]
MVSIVTDLMAVTTGKKITKPNGNHTKSEKNLTDGGQHGAGAHSRASKGTGLRMLDSPIASDVTKEPGQEGVVILITVRFREFVLTQQHPYVPRDLHLPDYVPCFLSQREIVLPYLVASLLLVTLIWLLSGRCSTITKTDRLLMCWWAFTGLTHIILEGYFAFTPEFYKEKTPHYLAEVWKEYSKSDSRYVSRDAAVVTAEGITAAIEGPACLLAV